MPKTGSHTSFPDHVRSIEFYHMYVQGRDGRAQQFQQDAEIFAPARRVRGRDGRAQKFRGAVLFGSETGEGCEIVRVIPPVPSDTELLDELAAALSAKRFAKLTFLGKTKRDVMSMLCGFCLQGVPLPNVFESASAHFSGLTPFQLKVYLEACGIPQGETRSYSWLSAKMRPHGAASAASRAVGGAMRSNPFPIFIPCHRIVLKSGAIGGFMGKSEASLEHGKGCWQLSLKKALLELEGLYRQPDLFSSDAGAPMAAQGANVFVLAPKLRDAV